MPTDNARVLFQRRHYDAIAAVIRDLGCVTEFQRQSLATEFALRIAETNARFDRARFVAACLPQVPDVPQVPQVPDVPQVPPVPVRDCYDCGEPATRAHVRAPGDYVFTCAGHACSTCSPITDVDN